MDITINGRELCAIQCALRESAGAATEAALLAQDAVERGALMANADLFSGLARTLEQRAQDSTMHAAWNHEVLSEAYESHLREAFA